MMLFRESEENAAYSQVHVTLAWIPQINHIQRVARQCSCKTPPGAWIEFNTLSATRGLSLSPGILSTSSRDVVLRHDEACLMFKKTSWTTRARRFLSRNWKFLVQTGVTILGILHR